MVDIFCLLHRVKTVVLPDVSWLVSLDIPQAISLPMSLFISKAEDSYHLNIFGGPPVLSRVIGISIVLRGASPIYKTGEVGWYHVKWERGLGGSGASHLSILSLLPSPAAPAAAGHTYSVHIVITPTLHSLLPMSDSLILCKQNSTSKQHQRHTNHAIN
jgi:hypothetical protein